ncbi:MAG: YSC84-related protein [Planctomycetota bacterium]
MITKTIGALAVCGALGLGLSGCASTKGATPSEKREYTKQMADDTLQELYGKVDDAQYKVENAAGYGVFSTIGTNLIFVTTGGGFGMVKNNRTGEITYMNMAEAGVGLGLGVKDFRAVFVFKDEDTLIRFTEKGWEFGGDADAAAKAGDSGGAAGTAVTVGSKISVYQLTKNGIALSATVSGTKYYKDSELN